MEPTGFMTNSSHLAAALSVQCDSRPEPPAYGHAESRAERYPLELCQAIEQGLKHHLLEDAAEVREMMHIKYSQPTNELPLEITHLMPALWEEVREHGGRRLCGEYLGAKGEIADLECEQALDELCAVDSKDRALQLRQLRPRGRTAGG